MDIGARIDPRLQWFKPEFVSASVVTHTIAVGSRRTAYDVDALAALRAFAYKVRDVPSAKEFVREYGPLVEPVDDKVEVSDMVKTRRALVAVWKAWRELDAKTLAQWRRMRRQHLRDLAEMGDPDEPSAQPATAADFPIDPDIVQSVRHGKRLVIPSDEVMAERNVLKARQLHAAPLLAQARLNTRVEFDGNHLLLRPNDLQSAMWLVVAQRIALGDASIPCRNAGCGNYVSRWLTDGNSMRAVYCEETRDRCTKAVRRAWERGQKEVDRYPHLEKLKGAAFLDAARKLRGEEVL